MSQMKLSGTNPVLNGLRKQFHGGIMKKYQFTDKVKLSEDGLVLHQIKSLVDIYYHGVRKGDLGGFIEKEENLSHDGDAWVAGNAVVFGDARVSENACVSQNACVSNNASIYGDAFIGDDAWISGSVHVCGRSVVCGNAHVSGNVCISGTSVLSGNARIS